MVEDDVINEGMILSTKNSSKNFSIEIVKPGHRAPDENLVWLEDWSGTGAQGKGGLG